MHIYNIFYFSTYYHVMHYTLCYYYVKVLILSLACSRSTNKTETKHLIHTNWSHILDKGIMIKRPFSMSEPWSKRKINQNN